MPDDPIKNMNTGETTVKTGTTLNNAVVQDATDDDPKDPLEIIIQKHGWPPYDSDPLGEAIVKHGFPDKTVAKDIMKYFGKKKSRVREITGYFKSRETKKTTKSVLLFLISQLPWLIYIVLDKLGGL